jgi:hypothetical protein
MTDTRSQTDYLCSSLAKLKGEDQKPPAKIAKYLCVVGVALVLSGAATYGQEAVRPEIAAKPAARDVAPPDCDFGRLGLQVTRVETVPSISSRIADVTYTPKDGRKLVVVHLKGTGKAPENFTQASNWSDIQAIYGQSEGMGFAIEPACAFVVIGADVWMFSKVCQAGGHVQTSNLKIDGHPVTSEDGGLIRIPNDLAVITVAFNLPAYVKTITLRFPTTARNAAGEVVQEIK